MMKNEPNNLEGLRAKLQEAVFSRPESSKQLLFCCDLAHTALEQAIVEKVKILEPELIDLYPGLKGALTRIGHITGMIKIGGHYDEDSEYGVVMSDRLKACGYKDAMGQIEALAEDELIRLAMVKDPNEAIQIVHDFRNFVRHTLSDIGVPIDI